MPIIAAGRCSSAAMPLLYQFNSGLTIVIYGALIHFIVLAITYMTTVKPTDHFPWPISLCVFVLTSSSRYNALKISGAGHSRGSRTPTWLR
jgi:hypothetical protein